MALIDSPRESTDSFLSAASHTAVADYILGCVCVCVVIFVSKVSQVIYKS